MKTMTFRVLPYRAGSRSANALAGAIPGARVLRLRGSAWRPRAADIVINWGNTDPPQYPCRVLNGMDLRNATNKLNFFRTMTNNDNGEIRSEERRVGKECVSKCRSRGSP